MLEDVDRDDGGDDDNKDEDNRDDNDLMIVYDWSNIHSRDPIVASLIRLQRMRRLTS